MKIKSKTTAFILIALGLASINIGILVSSFKSDFKYTLPDFNVQRLEVATSVNNYYLKSSDKRLTFTVAKSDKYRGKRLQEGALLTNSNMDVEVLVKKVADTGNSYSYIERNIKTYYSDTNIEPIEVQVNNRLFSYTILTGEKVTFVLATDIDNEYIYVVKATSDEMFDLDDIKEFLVFEAK